MAGITEEDEQALVLVITIVEAAKELGWHIMLTERKDGIVAGLCVGIPGFVEWVQSHVPEMFDPVS